MTLYTSNFKFKFLIVTLLIIFLVVSHFNFFISKMANINYVSLNTDLEGAAIISHRENGLRGDWSKDLSVAWVGTSRTIADYSPSLLKSYLSEHCSTQGLTFFNLGNVVSYIPDFEKVIQKKIDQNELSKLKIIFFELSPHQVVKASVVGHRELGVTQWGDDSYISYRNFIFKMELYISGLLRLALDYTDPLVLNGGFFKKVIAFYRSGELDVKSLYYLLRSQQGYGQKLQSDGQAQYRTYLTDKEGADIIKQSQPPDPENYNYTLSQSLDEKKVESLWSVLRLLHQNFKLVVVRPRVAKSLYEMENQKLAHVTQQQLQWLSQQGIPYVDLNAVAPTEEFSFVDNSHLDGFESERFNAKVVWPGLQDHLISKFCH